MPSSRGPYQESVAEILLTVGSGCEAIRRLIILFREHNPKWSHAFLAEKLGLRSRSHVADILSGRRSLTPRLWEPCLKLLALKGVESKLLKLLLKAEEEVLDQGELSEGSSRNLDLLRRTLQSTQFRFGFELLSSIFTMQVHATFDMFGNRVEKRQLVNFFGREHILAIERSLGILLREGIVTREQQVYSLVPEKKFISITAGDSDGAGPVEAYLLHCLELTRAALPKWAGRPELSCFRSAHVSVNKAAFVGQLEEFRADMQRQQAQFQADDADMLVRVDFQVYPIGEKAGD